MRTSVALDRLRRYQDALSDLLDAIGALPAGEAAARPRLAGLR